ncbi:MAG: FkbM family methyltransferase [Bryobacteraceae bacterium]
MSFTIDSFRRRITEQLPVALPPGTGIAASGRAESAPPHAAVIDLSSLYEISDNELFLREAYRLILGRETDVYGFVRFREMLRHYVSREVVVHHLVNSDEAKLSKRKFAGMRGLTGAAGNLRRGLRQRLQSIAATALLRMRNLAEIVMQGWRFEFLDVKMESIKQELTAESAQQFHKTEERFWQISEKLDTYVRDLQSRQESLLSELEGKLNLSKTVSLLEQNLDAKARAHSAKLTLVERSLEAGGQAFTSQLSRLTDRWKEFESAAAAHERTIEARLEKLEAVILHQQTILTNYASEQSAQFQRTLEDLQGGFASGFEEIRTSLPSWDAVAAHLSRVRGSDNVTVTQVDGFIVGVPAEEWRVAAYHQFRGAMEPGLLRAFREAIQPGMVVVDVGANIGMFTLHAAQRTGSGGKVISIEPAPRPLAILKENVQVNGFLEADIVNFLEIAVSDRTGTAQLTVYPGNWGHSTLFDASAAGQKLEVVTERLDDVLAVYPRIDVIKVDAEGAEPFILRGMHEVLTRNPHLRLFIEFAPNWLRRAGVEPVAFLDELTALGLAIQVVDEPSGELRDIATGDLLRCYSTNLSLRRHPRDAA